MPYAQARQTSGYLREAALGADWRRALGVCLLGAILTVAACATVQKTSVDLRETEDPFNQIHGALLEKGAAVKSLSVPLPKEAEQRIDFERDKPPAPAIRPPEKIHPRLKDLLAEHGPTRREVLVVSFKENVSIPRFPEPATDQSRDEAINKKALERTQALIGGVRTERAKYYQEIEADLGERYKAEVLARFWLVNALTVKMPLGAVRALAERSDVVYVEPDDTGTVPPQNANTNDDVQDGRARIVSDPYFNLGLTGGYIGLLDTGMRFSHTLFNSPSNVDFRRDCVNGGSNCNTGASLNPNDDCWNHGTSSGAIITANNNSGNAFRGVTGITLDSFKVYPTSFVTGTNTCNGFLSATASVRGYQSAIAVPAPRVPCRFRSPR